MLDIPDEVLHWLLIWSSLGASLGYFTIRDNPGWSIQRRVKEYLLSVGVGVFFAFPVYIGLKDFTAIPKDFKIMAAGMVAFGITDVLINFWPSIWTNIGAICNKIIDKLIGRI